MENDQQEIFCALISPGMSLPNLWEFPGGKVEVNEDIYTALKRENLESLKWAPVDIPAVEQLIQEK